jgi:LPS export ABC transporter protein LptC
MITRKTRRGIILLSLLALLTWILSEQQSQQDTNGQAARIDTRLNYALYEFKGRLLDDAGGIKLEIDSPLLRNDADSGVGTVEAPELHILQDQEQWYITAESAIITADREQVSLAGEVNLTRRNQVTGEVMEIDTSDVLLHVTPRTAETRARVTITQAGDRLDAVGMNLDMINDSYELLDDVRAHYEVP